MFRRVLVANRGEIAVRVIRGIREAGLESAALFTNPDRAAAHVRMADSASRISNYLDITAVLDAARTLGADAIHPGYGFLSENADFAAACESAGVVFIGPSSAAIRLMGSKTRARELAVSAGVPVSPAVRTVEEAERLGFPLMIKAVAGGGGKGMRRVDDSPSLEAAVREASSEAERAFGNGEIYIEKLIQNPRHIEIQVLTDQHGHVIHLGERECSLQRRHQKVIEECPSPLMLEYPELRERMGAAAVQVARAAGYTNAGTVEFLVDADRNFYFLEMNTRLQVEHPVTELVTGVDLVRWQLRIAAGDPLTIQQPDVRWSGAAVECRLYAEDPENQFFPSPGTITSLQLPSGPGIRVDSGIYPGWTVPMDYDPMLAKIAGWGLSREEAIVRTAVAMDDCFVSGIRTNARFFREILRDERFRRGELHTGFIQEWFARKASTAANSDLDLVAACVALHRVAKPKVKAAPASAASRWLSQGRDQLFRRP